MRGGYPVLPGWMSISRRWFQDVLDIEKLWSYWPHGGYLLPAGGWQYCPTPHHYIHFITPFAALKTDVKANVQLLKTLSRFWRTDTHKTWDLKVRWFGHERITNRHLKLFLTLKELDTNYFPDCTEGSSDQYW